MSGQPLTGETSTGTPTSPTFGPNPTGPRGPQRRQRRFGVVGIVIVVVVIVVIAGVFGYLYVNHALPGQGKVGGCNKSTSITVWQDFSSTEFPAFSRAVAQYESENPGQTVSWVNETTPSPSNYVAAALACQAPDILIGTSDFAGGLYFDGFLANLSEYLPSSAFSPFVPTALSDVTQSGAIYGFPLNVNGVAMIYNKLLVPTPPSTTNQMISLAQNITVTSGGKITRAGLIYGVDSDGGYRYPAWLTGYGGQMFTAAGLPDLNTSAAVNALTFLNNFSTVYKIEPPGVTAESTYEDLFAQGQVGMIFDGPWDIQMYVNALGASNVGVATIPTVSQTGLHPRPFWGSIGAFVSLRNASGASPTLFNESIKFAQFLASPTVEGELFNSSGDIPSLVNTFNYVHSLNIPFEEGFLDQFFNYSQAFPNTPQMTYFWDPYNTEISSYVSGSISASTAMGDIQSSIISEMQTNHIPPY
ncbi:MAG TPA: extracellular solute-binding protein [Thermoplasmata archaeon]|nr:extracellular solute-binding protein [Thermoplasmata archaeon]